MKKCFIICGGPESCNYVDFEKDSFVICADSGYDKAVKVGIKPDLILGDFDSVKNGLPDNCEIIRASTHKDDTDTMLAVKTALLRGYDDITLVAATGGRADHFIANIATLLYIKEHGANGRITGDETDAFILSNESAVIFPDKSRYLSVFAVTDTATVSIENAEYPLRNYQLSRSYPIGVSNEFCDIPCRVEAEKGIVLVMTVKK